MKKIGNLFILIGIILGLFGIRSCYRDYTYKQASIPVKASVKSVVIKPFSGKAVASIHYWLIYLNDGRNDSIKYSTTIEYSLSNPLPKTDELLTSTFYVRYVPNNRKNETSFPNRVIVSNKNKYDDFYNSFLFVHMLTLIFFGYMLKNGKK